jgi:hypothetical protein
LNKKQKEKTGGTVFSFFTDHYQHVSRASLVRGSLSRRARDGNCGEIFVTPFVTNYPISLLLSRNNLAKGEGDEKT